MSFHWFKPWQILFGVALLLLACFLSGNVAFALIFLTMGLGGLVGDTIGYVTPLAVVCLLLIYSSRAPGRGGYAVAPFVFFIGWFCVSIAVRAASLFMGADHYQAFDPATLPTKPKTLVVVDQLLPKSMLANGVIDTLVVAWFAKGETSGLLEEAVQYTIGQGVECSKDDLAVSAELHIAGRIDECYKATKITSLPDGLHIFAPTYLGGRVGVPAETTVTVVAGSQRTEILMLRQSYMRVPAFLPFFRSGLRASVERPTSAWESYSGPIEVISYGAQDIRTSAVIKLVYGVDPADPVRRSSEPAEDISAKAMALADTWEKQKVRLAFIMAAAQIADGQCNDACVSVLARGIALPPFSNIPFYDAFTALNEKQRQRLGEEVVILL